MMIRVATGFFLSCFLSLSWATNSSLELEYAKKIKSSLSMGKIVWLQAENKQFLSLYTRSDKKSRGAVILLHPMGGHPGQKRLINPLRTFLPLHNWATLSMQMPVLGIGAKEKEYFPLFKDAENRIQTGVDYLIDAGMENIMIVGYGLGSMMALYYINSKEDASGVSALVTISLSVPKSDKKQGQVLDFISKIEHPFFDIFAEFDLPEVVNNARERRLSAKANLAYKQLIIKGERHIFRNSETLVVKRIYSWINRINK